MVVSGKGYPSRRSQKSKGSEALVLGGETRDGAREEWAQRLRSDNIHKGFLGFFWGGSLCVINIWHRISEEGRRPAQRLLPYNKIHGDWSRH